MSGSERWRSKEARDLVRAVRNAGGDVQRTNTGRLRTTGPNGRITIHEPVGATRRDLRRTGAAQKITEATGLILDLEK